MQFGDHCAQVSWVAIGHNQIAARDCAGYQKCSRLDAIGIDAIACAMEPFNALDSKRRSAGPFDLRAHRSQQGRKVGNFRLTRAVFHEGFALCKHGRHQQVFSAGDGDLVKDNVRAFQPLRAGLKVSVFLSDGGAHLFQTLDMQIDRPAADGASAGHGYARHSRRAQ